MSCKTMSIDLANVPPVPIQIGVAGENSFRTITFDASKWGADYPGATYTVVYRRSDGYLYPVLVNASADAIVWSPTETDTAVSGNGQLEVRLLDGETIGKTIIMQTYVAPSLSGDESEPSTPAPDWVNDVADDADRAEAAVSHYPKIVNGVWFVWNATQSEFVSTGISAQGEDGVSPTVTVTAIEGGHRVTITGASGDHEFDVMDGEGGTSADAVLYTPQTLTAAQQEQARGNIGAKPPYYLTVTTENGTTYVDKTPAEINALSMAGYDVHARIPDAIGFVYDLRFVGYLASANLAALASEYSGRSISILVDATKAVEFTTADLVERINIIENDISTLRSGKADKDEIPSLSGYATETWVQNQGYQTAQDVQTAIAAIPDELPTVTAADNGKVLGVVNGAWAVKSDEGGSSVTVDSALSTTSENPVQNKVVKAALDGKADADEVYTKAEVDSAIAEAAIDPTSVSVDDTLTVAGAAADAETVGSLFTLMDMPMKQSVNWENGQWSQVHVWTEDAARVSPNPSVSVKKGDVLNVKIANGEKFAIGVWTVSGGNYTNREYGSYQFSDLTRTFQMDCEVSVVIAKTSDAAFTPSDVATKVEFYSIPEEQSIVEKVNKLSETAVEDGVPFEYAYEWGEVALGRNAYEAYPSGANANRERARAKQEYIRKVPVTASTVTVTIPAELMCNGKYKIGWAFYGNNFDQLSGTVKGWYTSATTFTTAIPSNAVYYMIYIATTSNQYSVDLSEIDYTSASIVFDNSSANQAKMDWFKHSDPPSGAVPLTKEPFLFSVNHRGYSTDAPENTLPAFVLSRKKGFRYVEADVLFTSDEVPVILHDDTINRTARNADGTAIGSTMAIADITFEQARTYDFGIWKGSAYAGTKVPSFAEFIQLCKQLSLTPLIELKDLTSWTDARIDKVAYLIKAVGMQNHVAFISFSKTALSKMSAHFPRAMLGLGYENTYDSTNISALATDAADLKNGENTVFVSVRNSSMTSALFEILESNGISSFVWTVNSERACASLHRNVIGVLSDSLNAGQIIEDALINS